MNGLHILKKNKQIFLSKHTKKYFFGNRGSSSSCINPSDKVILRGFSLPKKTNKNFLGDTEEVYLPV